MTFKHNSDGIVKMMLLANQFKRQRTMLQVALLFGIGKHASWVTVKLNVVTIRIRGDTQVIATKLLTCIGLYISHY